MIKIHSRKIEFIDRSICRFFIESVFEKADEYVKKRDKSKPGSTPNKKSTDIYKYIYSEAEDKFSFNEHATEMYGIKKPGKKEKWHSCSLKLLINNYLDELEDKESIKGLLSKDEKNIYKYNGVPFKDLVDNFNEKDRTEELSITRRYFDLLGSFALGKKSIEESEEIKKEIEYKFNEKKQSLEESFYYVASYTANGKDLRHLIVRFKHYKNKNKIKCEVTKAVSRYLSYEGDVFISRNNTICLLKTKNGESDENQLYLSGNHLYLSLSVGEIYEKEVLLGLVSYVDDNSNAISSNIILIKVDRNEIMNCENENLKKLSAIYDNKPLINRCVLKEVVTPKEFTTIPDKIQDLRDNLSIPNIDGTYLAYIITPRRNGQIIPFEVIIDKYGKVDTKRYEKGSTPQSNSGRLYSPDDSRIVINMNTFKITTPSRQRSTNHYQIILNKRPLNLKDAEDVKAYVGVYSGFARGGGATGGRVVFIKVEKENIDKKYFYPIDLNSDKEKFNEFLSYIKDLTVENFLQKIFCGEYDENIESYKTILPLNRNLIHVEADDDNINNITGIYSCYLKTTDVNKPFYKQVFKIYKDKKVKVNRKRKKEGEDILGTVVEIKNQISILLYKKKKKVGETYRSIPFELYSLPLEDQAAQPSFFKSLYSKFSWKDNPLCGRAIFIKEKDIIEVEPQDLTTEEIKPQHLTIEEMENVFEDKKYSKVKNFRQFLSDDIQNIHLVGEDKD